MESLKFHLKEAELMRIQIYGAGMAGSYLYELLSQRGYDVRIYDVRSKPDCRCAWGIAYTEAKELYSKVGVNLDDYVLAKPKEIVINDKIVLRNKNLYIFDRKRLLEDLWKDFELEKGDGDVVVDATGCARAILPKIENDAIYCTVQYIERHNLDENIYVQMRKTGYAWAFPLGDRWHIGAGDLTYERALELIDQLRRVYDIPEVERVCECRAKIRMLPPSKCKPIVHGNVYGVGEAIGCVSGGGEGNAPSLRCAYLFYECLEAGELHDYEKRVLEEFWWIEEEHKFLYAVQNDKKLTALRLLPKVVSIESKRSVHQSVRDIKNLLNLLR